MTGRFFFSYFILISWCLNLLILDNHVARSQQQHGQTQGGGQAGSQAARNPQQRTPAGGQQEQQWTVRSSSNAHPHIAAGQSQAPQVRE